MTNWTNRYRVHGEKAKMSKEEVESVKRVKNLNPVTINKAIAARLNGFSYATIAHTIFEVSPKTERRWRDIGRSALIIFDDPTAYDGPWWHVYYAMNMADANNMLEVSRDYNVNIV